MSVLKKLKEAKTLKDLAPLLGHKPSGLSYIVYKIPAEIKYTKFNIPKRSGGAREISAPCAHLKILQRRLADILYASFAEISGDRIQDSISHGFCKDRSIVTNAVRHKRRRYVLNIDLRDFFESINFGRVRGYFIKNKSFELDERIATIIAQIACHENALPQGSPCSPVISNAIAHILDIRLVQLAKANRVSYSRYADDLTFSTNQKDFPPDISYQNSEDNSKWLVGERLVNEVARAGFSINEKKTRMQFRASRQLVTGLTVNSIVNVRCEYYRRSRAMCNSLFKTGAYHVPALENSSAVTEGVEGSVVPASTPVSTSNLQPLAGVLSHIYFVKSSQDQRDSKEKSNKPTAFEKLYGRFLFYQNFIALKQPLVVCEGKTDNIYLKLAIRKLSEFHPKLGVWNEKKFRSNVSFFSYVNKTHRMAGLYGGTGSICVFLANYRRELERFEHRPLAQPVILLVDNDQGSKSVFKTVKENFGIEINVKSEKMFYHLTDNLYLIKTLEVGEEGTSCIEDCFQPSLLKTLVAGKIFNPKVSNVGDNEYGKIVFAEKVVRSKSDSIDFSGFKGVLNRIVAVIDGYVS